MPDEEFNKIYAKLLALKKNHVMKLLPSEIDVLDEGVQEALAELKVTEEELLPAVKRYVQEIEGRKAGIEYARKVYAPQMEFEPCRYDWKMQREYLCWWYENNLPKGREMRLTKDYHRIYTTLCKYFSADETCELDLDKGLLLMGCVGDGKTMLMRAFQKNQRQSYKVVAASDIAEDYKAHGVEVLKTYRYNQKMIRNRFGHTEHAWCIDDIGAESIYKNYGDPLNVVEYIVTKRFDEGLLTHFTTNLSADELKSGYGDRVASRLRQMVNVVLLPDEDLRQ